MNSNEIDSIENFKKYIENLIVGYRNSAIKFYKNRNEIDDFFVLLK